MPDTHRHSAVLLLQPPYTELRPATSQASEPVWGDAIIWLLEHDQRPAETLNALEARKPGVRLYVVLPHPDRIGEMGALLRRLRELQPAGILPGLRNIPADALRMLMMQPPPDVAQAGLLYLDRRGLLSSAHARYLIEAAFTLAGEISTVTQLARTLAVSRRTLGRSFASVTLPPPSHCLQFGRLLKATVRLQAEQATIGKAALRSGYPDGFTFSNQMKRLTGFRPSEVKRRLGWEWVVEAWAARESTFSKAPKRYS